MKSGTEKSDRESTLNSLVATFLEREYYLALQNLRSKKATKWTTNQLSTAWVRRNLNWYVWRNNQNNRRFKTTVSGQEAVQGFLRITKNAHFLHLKR